ncbi:hypothetical protein BofuT4_uP156930.1 [Botrytis cinerea T4]|uniref:Uncharacterized protein n=1 Tax=Botryotinia fuckeliana (strain T4) TaxID=999810 RepID=G2YUJ9_BOTF4|nr:hypothetical protein BofuT4_uP156930.1 [Botrytis cinerea T4]
MMIFCGDHMLCLLIFFWKEAVSVLSYCLGMIVRLWSGTLKAGFNGLPRLLNGEKNLRPVLPAFKTQDSGLRTQDSRVICYC